ncbi:hypothetical protein L2E82_22101 [Cichorium intybus]|uniref:Uncharacterized protein n=1 Tax=Cichorium intybus TaxID=13427 RepID=A0ACB9DWH1_CICIN|nr:hypothetical protein L2E82_22101 [Cichorium intybus]
MENRYAHVHSPDTKKNKVIWTPDLHKKFLEAVEKIGINEAVPKKILEFMKVEGLTRDHVASHLQKYRIFLKKIANANERVPIASKPSLLESSMINGDPWRNSSLMLNQPTPQQKNLQSCGMMNPPLLDTSSFTFPVLETSSFSNDVFSSSSFVTKSSLTGYSMQPSAILAQTIPNALDREKKLIANDPELGVLSSVCVNSSNSSNSSFMQNLDGVMHDYGGSTIDVHPYMSSEMGSSGGLYSMNHENPTTTENYFINSSNGFESSYYTHGEFVEMGSLHDGNSNELSTYWSNEMEMNTDTSNLQNAIEEDDLILDVAYITSLWETFFPEEQHVDYYHENGSTSNNIPVTYEPPFQDMNSQNLSNMVSFDSIHNEDHVNNQQQSNEQLMESLEDDVTLQTLILSSYVQD